MYDYPLHEENYFVKGKIISKEETASTVMDATTVGIELPFQTARQSSAY